MELSRCSREGICLTTLLFDIETDGLLDQLTTIHSLVIKDADTGEVTSCTDDEGWGWEKRPDYDSTIGIAAGLDDLAEADVIAGHNVIKFDIPAIQKVYPTFAPKGKVRDTLVLTRLLYPDIRLMDDPRIKAGAFPGNKRGRYSLEAFGYRLGLWKGDYSDMMKTKGLDPWASWNPEMQAYCEQDVEVTHALWKKCLARAEGFSDRSIELEHRVATIVARQERNGFAFDRPKAEKLYAELVGRRADLERELKETFAPWWVSEGEVTVDRTRRVSLSEEPWKPSGEKVINRGKPTERREPVYHKALYEEGTTHTKVKLREFNPQSRHHICDRLKTLFGWEPEEFTDSGEPKLDDAVISKLPWPEAKLLGVYLMVCKRISQLAEGKGALLRCERNGRIHGEVIPGGAVTRRMTHQCPNYNIPKVKKGRDGVLMGAAGGYGWEMRELFTAIPRRKLVGCDADSLEGRCLGGYMALYDGGAYIDALLKGDKSQGTDNHSLVAIALGLDPKGVYPKTVDKIGRDIAKRWFYAYLYGSGDEKLGFILTGLRGNAKAGRKGRLAVEKGLPALGQLVAAVKAKAKSQGFLKGLDGCKVFVRHQHAALNTLLQSAGAIIMKEALVILDDDLQAAGFLPGDHYEFCANVHDEWQIEAEEAIATQVGVIAAEAIRKAGESLHFKCPLAGNSDVGDHWAATH